MDENSMAYNARIEALRKDEFPMLHDGIYLDHAGTTLYSKSLVDAFAAEMTTNLFGNPHSASASSQCTMARIEKIRYRVLQFFNADPAEFDLVFVANATAGIKMVSDAFRGFSEGFNYLYHHASHTSLVGVRQEARNSLCLDTDGVNDWIERGELEPSIDCRQRATLFAYPAQSNMDGRRYPLDWGARLRGTQPNPSCQMYTLLDAAAYVATSPLDLGNVEAAPDFTVLSFYKIFGFPDLGGLIVKREAASIFTQRRYFGGGTVDMVTCTKEQWHAPKTQSLHETLEDGTLPIHSIIALDSALDVHHTLYGTMTDIALHTSFLARQLYRGLEKVQHGNGQQVCVMYSTSPDDTDAGLGNGAVVAFNLRTCMGAWISLTEFEKLAVLKNFHVRTGGLCNPGGIAAALGLEPWEMKQNFSAGFRCGNEHDVINGKPTGVIRVSLGAMSTLSDVDNFIAFIEEFYREDRQPQPVSHNVPTVNNNGSEVFVDTIMVYPIKSCGGFRIPAGLPWAVRSEGLAWDREWCLVHPGTGLALTQKRYSRMALIRPSIDLSAGKLRVSYQGPLPESAQKEISVPLSLNPEFFRPVDNPRSTKTRVCGDGISTMIYKSHDINTFFSNIIGTPCALARFPPGGSGNSMRHAKAHLQSHQTQPSVKDNVQSHRHGIQTPPDSDEESERRRILLSNESPILAINLSSLAALNRDLVKNGGSPVYAETFRANIVIGSSSSASKSTPEILAYSEDEWDTLRIGTHNFKMLGACRRCHMVCINQNTAAKSDEPFLTLAKTRRFNGKVFFGVHMCHIPMVAPDTREAQSPTISIGDKIAIDPL
ncbi:molybdenum cofactor sulfurase [Xylaria bambusicola]|uniref:molybdenum cofactor sulfurase n=1 Tax=Xylaria bambusicola TaxID=326684 RepID=UPI002007671A|nr:molybdenum cofactor sulfurase [Xylaria bambusicola]KAI0516844.1 molybdenum cofactor sulfurase [Xylaria bambusicola]